MGGLPPVFIEFLGKSTGVKTALRDIKAETGKAAVEGETSFSKFGRLGSAAVAGIGIAAAGAAIATVHMAADFQTQMTRVRTGAGEAAGNMKMVGDGVLAMAGQVGQSTSQLTSGLYLVESAGYHGADALTVLKTAAMGAKVGAADLGTTSDALTTAMNAYKMSASDATGAMNALIATEGQGKTNLEALAGSMASILPTAAAAHVGLNEVLGAMATMTSQGTAAVAATYLRQTIGMLSNPSGKAAQEMKSLGLSAVQVSQNLGKNGLASTLTELTTAIEKHMGPAGTVLIAHLQAAAKNTTAYQKVLANLPPAQQTYIGALATMVGGTKSMQAALELTGPHMKDFQDNTKTIAEHVKAGGKGVEGWADVQKTFNQRMAEAKAGMQAMAIQIGNELLPIVTKMAGIFATAVTWLTKHKQVAEALAIVIGGALVFALAAMTASLYAMAVAAATNPITWIVLGVVALIAAIVLLIMHWKEVWSVIKTVGLAIGHAVAAAWDWVAKSTEAAWKWVVKAVTGAWHSVASFFVGAWHAVADPIVGAWKWVQHASEAAWNAIVGFFVGAWHAVVDPIVGAWQWIVDATTSVWNGIVGFFKRWWPLLLVVFMPFVAAVVSIWNHFHTQIIGTALSVWHTITAFFASVWNGIKVVAGAVWTGIQVAIINPILDVWHMLVEAWNTVSGWLSAAWQGIQVAAGVVWQGIKIAIINPITDLWHLLMQTWNTASNWLGTLWRGIASAASSVWNSIKTAIINPITNAWQQIVNIGGKIGSAISGAFHSALNAVANVGSWFVSLGDNIIMGIINGISNAAGSLFDALMGVAKGALNAAKSFLGINSPSKVFADHVGMAIPEGIAKGVTDNAHLAHRAVTALAGQISAQTIGVGTTGIGLGTAMGGFAQTSQQVAEVTTIVQLDGQEILRALQPHALRYDKRNGQPGLVLARS